MRFFTFYRAVFAAILFISLDAARTHAQYIEDAQRWTYLSKRSGFTLLQSPSRSGTIGIAVFSVDKGELSPQSFNPSQLSTSGVTSAVIRLDGSPRSVVLPGDREIAISGNFALRVGHVLVQGSLAPPVITLVSDDNQEPPVAVVLSGAVVGNLHGSQAVSYLAGTTPGIEPYVVDGADLLLGGELRDDEHIGLLLATNNPCSRSDSLILPSEEVRTIARGGRPSDSTRARLANLRTEGIDKGMDYVTLRETQNFIVSTDPKGSSFYLIQRENVSLGPDDETVVCSASKLNF